MARITRRTLSEQQGTLFASIDEVRDQCAEWSDAFLECRENRHAWVASTARRDRKSGTIERVKTCKNCGSEREDIISARTGEVTRHAVIRYAEGYLLQNVGRIAGPGRDILRLIGTERLYPELVDIAPDKKTRARKTATTVEVKANGA